MVKYSYHKKYKKTHGNKYKSKIIGKRKLKGGYKTKRNIKSRITKTRRIKKSMRGGNPYISNEIGIHLSKREYDALTSQQRKDLMLYCPDKAPYLCSLESKSYGLCRKTANDCNKIIPKYPNILPISLKTLDSAIGKKFGYHSKNIANTCYPARGIPTQDFVREYPGIKKKMSDIKILTYNIWGLDKGSADYENKSFMTKRMNKIKDILISSDADILCLQEMSKKSFDLLITAHADLRQKYPYMSEDNVMSNKDMKRERNRTVDIFFMSKIKPVRVIMVSSEGNLGYNNPIMIIEFKNFVIFNIYTQAGSKHSPGQETKWIHYARCRREGFQLVREMMDEYGDLPILLVGDFNCNLDGLYNDWPERGEIIQMHLKDTWNVLKPNDRGYTEDTDINHMRWNQKQIRKTFRYDAIKYKNGFVPQSIEMIGTTGFNLTVSETAKYLQNYNIDLDKDNIRYANPEKTLINMWPSDHFGLLAHFTLNTQQDKKLKKYRIKLIKIIEEHFPKKSFIIRATIIKDEIRILIMNGGECLTLKLKADNIFVSELGRCFDSGTLLLSKIKDIAQRLGLKSVSLDDASSIDDYETVFSLTYLQILTTGQSWYNKHGFVSTDYDKEILHNKKIIEDSFINTFDNAIQQSIGEVSINNGINKTRMKYILEYVNSLISKNETHPFICRNIVEMNQKLKEFASDNSLDIPEYLQTDIDCNDLLTVKTYLEELLKNVNSPLVKKYNEQIKRDIEQNINDDKQIIIETLNTYVPNYKDPSMTTKDVFNSLKNNPQFRDKTIDYSVSLDKLLDMYTSILLYDSRLTYTL